MDIRRFMKVSDGLDENMVVSDVYSDVFFVFGR